MRALVIVGAVVFLIILSALGGYTIAQADTVIHIKEGSLGNHQCDSSEWHFIITQVSDPQLAPSSVHIVWANGNEADVPLDGVTGQAAHYYDYSNLDSPVVDGWTSIYDGWSGEFNLSHGPCFDEPTPTPTNTEVPSATPTNTATATPTKTFTSTSTPTSTSSPTQTQTDTPTMTPTDDPGTDTPTPTGTQPTATSTSTSTNTATPTVPPTATQTPSSTLSPTVTPLPTQTETPRPPVPAVAFSSRNYQGASLGTIFMDGHSYKLFQGINAPDGTLALPSTERGAALYNNVIWVHRAWNTGWLNLEVGDIVMVTIDDSSETYKVVKVSELPYGVYPEGNEFSIATCMSNDGQNWTNVQLFTLQLLRVYNNDNRK